ncbi:MAG: type transporter [Pedosphaera sp.]|nr:type transporter [Pedosphaera sp.]
MIVLPIVDRELRVAARRAGTYWMRFGAALIVLVIWVVLLFYSRQASTLQMGQHLLNALGILALGFSMLAGVFLTSDCLSEEKREGTLGLLYLTDLKSYDIVFGKFVATSLHACFGLLAIFPILGLTLLLGGVTGQEFARLLLVFVMTLFFSLSLGMFVSAVNHEAKQAIMHTFLAVLMLAGACPALWWLQTLLLKTNALDFLLWPSPGYAYMNGFDSWYRFGLGSADYWHSLETLFFMGLICIIAANIVLPRSWQEGNPSRLAQAWHRWRAFFFWTDASPRKARHLPFLAGNPFYWLTVRDSSPRRMARKALLILTPIWLLAIIISVTKTSRNEPAFITAMFVAFGLHLIIKTLVIIEASRRMSEDRQSGALELLLVTPLSVQAILAGQKAALTRHFIGSLITLGCLNLGLVATVLIFSKALHMSWDDQFIFIELFLGGILMLVMDFWALGWVGMWRGLNAQKHHRAVIRTLIQIMAIPWVIIFFLIFLQQGFRSAGSAAFTFGCWFGVGAIVDLVSSRAARRKLEQQLRSAASQRF